MGLGNPCVVPSFFDCFVLNQIEKTKEGVWLFYFSDLKSKGENGHVFCKGMLGSYEETSCRLFC